VNTIAYPMVDIALSRLLERAEGHANSRSVESRARQVPELGACWMEAGGTYAMFDGPGSPLTQTFGLGVFEPITAETLDALEQFFLSRGSDVFHEVSPLADPAVLNILPDRGYRPCELTSLLFQPLPAPLVGAASGSTIVVRQARADEMGAWAETAVAGWGEFEWSRAFMSSFAPVAAGTEDSYRFFAFDAGKPIATSSLAVHGEVALLAGAATIPEARGRGAQRALLTARLQLAAGLGCTLAVMGAAPGSPSQRNAERSGFRIAYTRIKWHKAR